MFVDFRRAFPSTSIETVKLVLKKRGAPESVLRLIDSLYMNASECITVNDRVTVRNNSICGLRQGCPASPSGVTVIQAVMDVVLRLIDHKLEKWRIDEKDYGPSQAFADDLGVMGA